MGILFLVTGGLFYLLLRKLDLQVLSQALLKADLRLLGAAAVISLVVCMGACALRLHCLLQGVPPAKEGSDPSQSGASLSQIASLFVATSAVHNLLPAPAGEVLRTVQLHRVYGYALSGMVLAQVVEKLVEAISLGSQTGLVAAWTALPPAISVSLWGVAALGVFGALLCLVLARLVKPSQSSKLFGRFLSTVALGAQLFRSPWVWLKAIGYSVLADLGNAATVGLCAGAVGVSLAPIDWVFVVLLTRVVGIVPSTPGQFGVQEASVVLGLTSLGIEQHKALALALLHHLVHFVPVTLVGLLELRKYLR